MEILSVADPLAGQGDARKRAALAPARHCNWSGGGYSPRDFARTMRPAAPAAAPDAAFRRTDADYVRVRAGIALRPGRRGRRQQHDHVADAADPDHRHYVFSGP